MTWMTISLAFVLTHGSASAAEGARLALRPCAHQVEARLIEYVMRSDLDGARALAGVLRPYLTALDARDGTRLAPRLRDALERRRQADLSKVAYAVVAADLETLLLPSAGRPAVSTPVARSRALQAKENLRLLERHLRRNEKGRQLMARLDSALEAHVDSIPYGRLTESRIPGWRDLARRTARDLLRLVDRLATHLDAETPR